MAFRSRCGRLFPGAAVFLALVPSCQHSCSKSPPGAAAGQARGGPLGRVLPGAPAFDEATLKKLEAAWAARRPDYRPRTRHLERDGTPTYTNRLLLQSSPYLRQHAHNPVNWFPWGDEAFALARKLGRPVLLSVGYSTCHWCHVMEEESFEDEEIARYLNEHYIAVKVDREERPDVDAIYMTAVNLVTGHGGWPMTVWLTPDRRPFYGGTYFPPRDGDRGAAIGFLTLLARLSAIHAEYPDRVAQSAAAIAGAIHSNLSSQPAGRAAPEARVAHEAARFYRENFDSVNGGLAQVPKFPSNLPVRFLLRYHRRTGDKNALHMAVLTLEKMAAGGMYDLVGGGFHRYSTDGRWLVPHFEKMLYDNALLALAYLEGYQVTGREGLAHIVREVLRYVERDMTSPTGAFYSATDADSPAPGGKREEGWFFTWTPGEIQNALGKERAPIVEAAWGVTKAGNFEGRNILHMSRPVAEVAATLELPLPRLAAVLDESRELLYRARAKRPPPLRDEKILAAWNGLMISAHAQAALVLGDLTYSRRAAKAATFVLTHMRRGSRLLRSYKDGQARHNAYLDDYASLIAGLLDLYEATSELRWLREAMALDSILERHYEDRDKGGYFRTSDDHEKLLAREKPNHDGAEPGGNSIQALNLLRLHELTTEDRYRKRAEATLKAFAPALARSPTSLAEMLLAVDFHHDTPKEVVLVAPSSRDQVEPFLAALRRRFLPSRVLSVVVEGEDLERHAEIVPLVAEKKALGGKATAYVCERRICELPTTDPKVFARQIASVRPLGKSKTKTAPR